MMEHTLITAEMASVLTLPSLNIQDSSFRFQQHSAPLEGQFMLETVFPRVGFLKLSCCISYECQGLTVIESIKKKKKPTMGEGKLGEVKLINA